MKYIYEINGGETARKDFVRFVSEECECKKIEIVSGIGASIPDYKAGERIARNMQSFAKRTKHKSIATYMSNGMSVTLSVVPIEF